jgi:hypothetical protein
MYISVCWFVMSLHVDVYQLIRPIVKIVRLSNDFHSLCSFDHEIF